MALGGRGLLTDTFGGAWTGRQSFAEERIRSPRESVPLLAFALPKRLVQLIG